MARKLEIHLNTSDFSDKTHTSLTRTFADLINGEYCMNDDYRKHLNNEIKTLLNGQNKTQKHKHDETENSYKKQSKLLSKFLNSTIGSPGQVRIRKIQSDGNKFATCFGVGVVFTGSRQEGLRLQFSDIDLMLEVPVQAEFSQPNPELMSGESPFIIHTAEVTPGFALFECKIDSETPINLSGAGSGFDFLNMVLANGIEVKSLFLQALAMLVDIDESGRRIVSSQNLNGYFLELLKLFGVPFSDNQIMHPHGPCASGGDIFHWDTTIGLFCPGHSPYLDAWSKRERQYGWPTTELIHKAINCGFHLVPIGDKTSRLFPLEWRFSFCLVELDLIDSFNHTQLQCYALLKVFLTQVIEAESQFHDILSSYFMKTLMFWAVEESPEEEWVSENLIERFKYCIYNYLMPWIRKGVLPNYFIPERNMLEGKLDTETGEQLSRFIEEKYNGGWNFMSLEPTSLCKCFTRHVPHFMLLRTRLSSPWTPVCFLEKEWEQIHDYTYFIEVLGSVELPLFLQTTPKCIPPTKKAILKRFNSREIPSQVEEEFVYLSIHEWHKEALKMAEPDRSKNLSQIKDILLEYIDKDVSSYRLCLATFHYVSGDYEAALKLSKDVDQLIKSYVVHLNSAGFIETEKSWEITRDIKYLEEICGKGMSMNEKRKKALARDYRIPPGSQLSPKELQITNACEMSHPFRILQLSPILYSQFLKFLCLHHLGQFDDRDLTLQTMHITLNEGREKIDYWHHAYLLIGICHEMKLQLDEALHYFSKAYHVIKRDNVWYYEKSVLTRTAVLLKTMNMR